MLVTHGTTLERAQDILRNGFDERDDIPYVWNCSDSSVLYAYNVAKFNEYDDHDVQSLFRAITESFGNAQIAAALTSKASYIVTFVIDVPENIANPDESCLNMEHAITIDRVHLDLSNIVSIHIAPFMQRLSLMYLCGLENNHHLRTHLLSDLEYQALKSISKLQEGWVSDLMEIEFHETSVTAVLSL